MAKGSAKGKDYGSGLCCPHCSLSKYPCANMTRAMKDKESDKETEKDKD